MARIAEVKIISNVELREHLEKVDAVYCFIYPYGYYDHDMSEEPVAYTFGIDNTIWWLCNNPAYAEYGDSTGYYITVFDADKEYIGSVIY